ncbi:porin [Paraburkholderia sp.]|uniref:porin n=1 Tax=Paraburkholderia sp. TaxID=1926495 RepID=UPI002D75C802|nr:porin [Paraburkholderia sp.]HZZ02656.1 porin [Paraburkholderia sp.]
MNKRLFILALSLIAEQASAQSVTLYGAAGGGVRWVNNLKGGSAIQFSSIESKNRFGLRGVEDLGGGVNAIFLLENTFSTGTGALGKTDTLFDAAAYVGVSGRYGQLTFGRQLSVAEDLIVDLDPSRVAGSTAPITPDALIGTNYFVGDTRFNNMVKYKTKIGGAGLGASYSFGGVAGNTRAGSNYAASLTYQTGPLYGGASYQRTYNPDASQFAQTWQVGGYWQIGPARLFLSYLQLMVSGAGATSSQRRDSIPQGGISIQPTPALVLTAAFYDDIASNLGNARGANGHKTTAYGIVDYFLSKRTNVYLEVDRNTFTGAYRTDPLNIAVFSRNPASTASTGVTIGMTTRF